MSAQPGPEPQVFKDPAEYGRWVTPTVFQFDPPLRFATENGVMPMRQVDVAVYVSADNEDGITATDVIHALLNAVDPRGADDGPDGATAAYPLPGPSPSCGTLSSTTTEENPMTAMTATDARKNLFGLIKQVNDDHEPIEILSKGGTAVLIAKEDWDSIVETAYLMRSPANARRLRESIEELRSGGGITKTMDELYAMAEDEPAIAQGA